MPIIRELPVEQTHRAYEVMLELRPEMGSKEDFVARVNGSLRPEGYRLVASFGHDDEVAAVAGFRTGHNLAWGHFLYVDDLVTAESARRKGHAGALMDWLDKEAERLGCDQFHLDSATFRYEAHRFYFNRRLVIPGFHFSRPVR